MDLAGIKNIVLDLGGVIINLNQELTIAAFKKLFQDQFDEIFKAVEETKWLDRFEVGEFSELEFCQFFQKFNVEVSNDEIKVAWNKMLLDIPIDRIKTIKNLKEQYNVFLLSNTNEIHYQYIESYVNQEHNLAEFSQLFHKVYLSHKINLRKPNKAIFEFVLKDSNLLPEETLFIDDSKEHVDSAKGLGIKAYHLNIEEENLKDFF